MKGMNDDLFDDSLSGKRIDRMGRDFCIIENPMSKCADRNFPIRNDSAVSAVVISGSMKCMIDMTEHSINEPGMLLVLPSQIVERISFSDDFMGYCIIMSSSFLANMPMSHKVPLISDIKQTGFYPMNRQFTDVIENYARMVQAVLQIPDNSYKNEIITHLTIAYYYGLGTYIHKVGNNGNATTRYGQIADCFFELVRDNCHQHRDMAFYSDALSLSAKHISLAVKKVTGENAMKWIERYTVLKAKSLLKTTGLSVSEISYRLNFPTPSDFGKYFKKFTGLSPKAFRNK